MADAFDLITLQRINHFAWLRSICLRIQNQYTRVSLCSCYSLYSIGAECTRKGIYGSNGSLFC